MKNFKWGVVRGGWNEESIWVDMELGWRGASELE